MPNSTDSLDAPSEHPDEDGYELWLRYRPIDAALRYAYQLALSWVVFPADSPTLQAAQSELTRGLQGLLGSEPALVDRTASAGASPAASAPDPGGDPPDGNAPNGNAPYGALLVGTPASLPELRQIESQLRIDFGKLGDEGFAIGQATLGDQRHVYIAAHRDVGVLYGVFYLLRWLQTRRPLHELEVAEAPRVKLRMLNHWDNLDRTVERGYAGSSLWNWQLLPDYRDPRYTDYARACASVGLNATVLTNVNANARVLTPEFLEKVAALAEVFRPYGLRVFLTARFNAPMELGDLETADPIDSEVIAWWQRKAEQIYQYIPDFGGFVVKANSEGQPGPEDFARTHAEGANLLARALAPHDGVVIWRAFVYDDKIPDDRAKQANNELVPLDGTFDENVFLQAKNGPIDFQPREPHHPLFGTMPKTKLMIEFQLTQEYLGFATHLVYLATMFEETLRTDTFAKGEGSTVAKVVDGSLEFHRSSGMAAVANIGNDRNWCGHPFAAANWYAYGRLAWDHQLSAAAIAEEWLRMTFSNDPAFLDQVTSMILRSREACVDYMTPLGLHHLMACSHHYGPGPWFSEGRPDWTSVYYHRADARGIGFDRTRTGSNAVAQYFLPVHERYENLETCPENLLLWFHHVPWDHPMKSGRTLWDELCFRYQRGVDEVRAMQQTWQAQHGKIDAARHGHACELLKIQEKEARWWRDACLLYFQTFSGRPISDECEKPSQRLEHFVNIEHHYVPGI